ncbi:MAG TPA: cation diffusion facilitator family transporter [Nitrospira sp.]|nr:cation diffusion facilitator family transporter [Nitrospira sp.]
MVPHTYHELRSRLRIALALNAVIIVAEFVGGFLTNSIGLIGDAGHNLVDQGSLFLALYAHILTARPATDSRTFGYHRAGIVAAFLNSFILLLTAVGITIMSAQRILTPVPIPGGWVMLIALISFVANLSIALLLQHGAKDDLNIRSAFWHMLSDAWVSLGVVVSGGAIMLTGWSVLDPLVSLFVVVAIIRGAWPLFKESLEVLLESTPPGVSPAQVAATIESIPGVKNVHDLHIWAVEPRLIMMTTHVQVDGHDEALTSDLLHTIRERITTDFGIKHLTIQLETECCHPEAVHCDLNKLAGQRSHPEFLHSHH